MKLKTHTSKGLKYNNVEFAQGLLDALGEGWEAKAFHGDYPHSNYSFKRTSDGVGFWARDTGGKNSRWEFCFDAPLNGRGRQSAVYRKTGSGRLPHPSITCAKTKSGEQLARDVAKRLLPDLEEVHALYLEQIEKDDAYEARRKVAQEVADELNEVKGLRFSPDGAYVIVEGYVKPDVAQEIHRLLSK